MRPITRIRKPEDEGPDNEIAEAAREAFLEMPTEEQDGRINAHATSLEKDRARELREAVVIEGQGRGIKPQTHSFNQGDPYFVDRIPTIEEGPDEEDRRAEPLAEDDEGPDEEMEVVAKAEGPNILQAIPTSPILIREEQPQPTPPRFSPIDTTAAPLRNEQRRR